jgi:hypothetical protein
MLPRSGADFLQSSSGQFNGWLCWVPSAWFAGGVQYLLGSNIEGHFILFLLAISGIVVALFIMLQQFSFSSVRLSKKMHSGEERFDRISKFQKMQSDRIGTWIDRIFHSPEFSAGFQLTLHLIKRDRSVKLGLYPVFGIPLAFLLLAFLEGGLTDPFMTGPFTGSQGTTAIVIFFVFFMIYFFTAGVVYIRDWEAGWIYRVAPIEAPGRFYQGVKLAIFLRLLFPFFVLLGILYCIQIPLIHGLFHTLSLFILSLVASSMVSLFLKEYPFSRKREKGERNFQFGFLLFVVPFFGIMIAVQSWIYQDNHLLWIALGSLIVLFLVLEWMASTRLNRVLHPDRICSRQ